MPTFLISEVGGITSYYEPRESGVKVEEIIVYVLLGLIALSALFRVVVQVTEIFSQQREVPPSREPKPSLSRGEKKVTYCSIFLRIRQSEL